MLPLNRQVTVFVSALTQLVTGKECGMVREGIMNAHDGVPSQPCLWMIWDLVSHHRAAITVKRTCLRAVQSSQAPRWHQDNWDFIKESKCIFKVRKIQVGKKNPFVNLAIH